VIGFEGVLDLDSTESLEELCKEEKCLFVQVETIDYYMQPLSFSKGENSSVDSKEQADRSVCAWKSGYYKKFIPPYTALIDLTQSEDEILAAMKPKGRYNIKLAGKK
jgi:lipid II:glycine glycyltransferase (peptidoglycan interpeptide bridge formation enzyme)